jgi:ParB family chromosome partitioning protein
LPVGRSQWAFCFFLQIIIFQRVMSDKISLKKRTQGLGRGLDAILNDHAQDDKPIDSHPAAPNAVFEIPVTQIESNPYQPRTEFDQNSLQELAESIKVQGIIQPITVRQLSAGKYQLIAGERRWRASQLAGLATIPAYVRTANDQQMLEMALIENIQRENLNPIEIALSYQRLIAECNLIQDQLGERVGKNRATIANYLRLLRLPPEIQYALKTNQISMGHAKALLALDKIEDQLFVFKRISMEELSVRKVEEIARQLLNPKNEPLIQPTKPKPLPKFSHEIKHLQSRLSGYFGTQVKIKSTEEDKGEIVIPYMSTEDLNRILELIDSENQ